MNAGFWHRIPFIRLLFPFAAGTITALLTDLSPIWINTGLIWGLMLVCCFSFIRVAYSRVWLTGLSASCCFFFLGLWLMKQQDVRTHPDWFGHDTTNCWIIATAGEDPVEKKRSWKVRCRVEVLIDATNTQTLSSGKILVYLQKNETESPIRYGNRIAFRRSLLKQIAPPANPGEFNLQFYQRLHQTFHQVYLKSENYRVLPSDSESMDIKGWAIQVQHHFNSILEQYIGTGSEQGVARALLYGNDDAIDPETIQSYAHTGTLHVLAVSGMHVGILFLLLNVLLKRLNKKAKIFKAAIVLLVLWAYSVLCGLSPSILRATVMFSFLVIAKTINRPVNSYNTLASSAFLLLCMDGHLLAFAGFQLSYLAVLGIVLYQPYVQSLFTPRNYLLRQIWTLTAVSLAAQLGTAPISLLYFQQFPNIFLISNIFIIPLTTVILYGCLLLVAISPVSFLAGWLGIALKYLLQFTNELTRMLEHIPFAYTEGLVFSPFQIVLMYLFLFAITGYFLKHEISYLYLSLVTVLTGCCLSGYNQLPNPELTSLTVYRIPGHTGVRLHSGNFCVLLADSGLLADPAKKRFFTTPHLWELGKTREVERTLSRFGQVLSIGNKKIGIVLQAQNTNDTFDLVILSPPYPHPESITWVTRKLILQKPLKPKSPWWNYLNQHQIPFHILEHQGAYRETWEP